MNVLNKGIHIQSTSDINKLYDIGLRSKNRRI